MVRTRRSFPANIRFLRVVPEVALFLRGPLRAHGTAVAAAVGVFVISQALTPLSGVTA